MKKLLLAATMAVATVAIATTSFAAGYPKDYAAKILANKVPLVKAVEIALATQPGRIGAIGYVEEDSGFKNVFHAFIVGFDGVTYWVKINADDGKVIYHGAVPSDKKMFAIPEDVR